MHALPVFLKDMADSSAGFSFGSPERPAPDSVVAVVPILRQIRHTRTYATLAEIGQGVSIEETGSVDQGAMHNTTSTVILVLAAWILVGDVQSRAVTETVVLGPREERRVTVACVHESDFRLTVGAAMGVSGTAREELSRRSTTGSGFHVQAFSEKYGDWQGSTGRTSCQQPRPTI